MKPGDEKRVQIELFDRKLACKRPIAVQSERELPRQFRVSRFRSLRGFRVDRQTRYASIRRERGVEIALVLGAKADLREMQIALSDGRQKRSASSQVEFELAADGDRRSLYRADLFERNARAAYVELYRLLLRVVSDFSRGAGFVAPQFGVRQAYLVEFQVKLAAQAVETDSFRVDVLEHEIAVEQRCAASAATAEVAGQES